MIEVTVPAGFHIRYRPESEGRRAYWLRGISYGEYVETRGPGDSVLAPVAWVEPEWIEVPSVSTVNEILDKPALVWWGMRVGFDAMLTLWNRKVLGVARYGDRMVLTVANQENDPAISGPTHRPATRELIEAAAKEHRLTTNHIRDAGGDRGTAAHAVLEAWASIGVVAEPAGYPDAQEGYVRGVQAFCRDAQIEEAQTEVMVGSLRHKFAGRYDLRGIVTGDLWTGTGPRAKRIELDHVPTLLDLKTSKYVYINHFLQLEGYEGASIESGYDPTRLRMVVHVTPEGMYEVKVSDRTYDDFLAIRSAYHALKRKGNE